MERLKAHEIAHHIDPKIDPAHVRGTQDWIPDTHSHLTISELVYQVPGQESVVIPFRVTNRETGEIHTRLAVETHCTFDHAKVLGTFASVLQIQHKKNLVDATPSEE